MAASSRSPLSVVPTNVKLDIKLELVATSRSPLSIVPADVKLDIKLELADGSLLPLTQDQVLKSLTIKDVTVDVGLYTLTIPIDKYPANKVWQFFSLFDDIEKRADLAQQKVTLSQLIEMLPIADYFAAETIMNNLIDYILATILANLNMPEEAKKKVQDKYAQLSNILDDAVRRRLVTKMNETSVKNVRMVPLDPEANFSEVIITDQGQVATNYRMYYRGYGRHRYEQLYDETDNQRERKLNQLAEKLTYPGNVCHKLEIELGGIVENKISIFLHTYYRTYLDCPLTEDTNDRYYYPPGQLAGDRLLLLPPYMRLFLYGLRGLSKYSVPAAGIGQKNRLLSIYKTVRANGQKFDELDGIIFEKQFTYSHYLWIYRIIELPSRKALFSNLTPAGATYEDQAGKYLVTAISITTSLAPNLSGASVIELFEVDSKKRLFRIIIDGLRLDEGRGNEIIIDPIRRLLYIKINNYVEVNYSITNADISPPVILIINFKGQIIHRYLALRPYIISLKVIESKLLTIEFHLVEDYLKGDITILQTSKFVTARSIFISTREIAQYQKMAELPPYEFFPDLQLKLDDYQHDMEDDVFIYGGVWLRDPDNGYQPIARISDLPILVTAKLVADIDVEKVVKINSSPTGHYITLNVPRTKKVQIYKLTLYDQAEAKAIMDILTPTTE